MPSFITDYFSSAKPQKALEARFGMDDPRAFQTLLSGSDQGISSSFGLPLSAFQETDRPADPLIPQSYGMTPFEQSLLYGVAPMSDTGAAYSPFSLPIDSPLPFAAPSDNPSFPSE